MLSTAGAAGLEIHTMVRPCDGHKDPACEKHCFSALPDELEALAPWLT